jgi:hypothetical protein
LNHYKLCLLFIEETNSPNKKIATLGRTVEFASEEENDEEEGEEGEDDENNQINYGMFVIYFAIFMFFRQKIFPKWVLKNAKKNTKSKSSSKMK